MYQPSPILHSPETQATVNKLIRNFKVCRWCFTIDLCDMSTTLHADSNVDASKALLSQQQNGLQQLRNKGTPLQHKHPSNRSTFKTVKTVVLLFAFVHMINKMGLKSFTDWYKYVIHTELIKDGLNQLHNRDTS